MQWLLDNWIWILFGGGMIAMHLFGHGGHGGRGKRRNKASQTEPQAQPSARSTSQSLATTDDGGEAGPTEKRRDL